MAHRTRVLVAVGLFVALTTAQASDYSEPAIDTRFESGTRPISVNGNEVHAHGGCMLQHNGTWHWFGTTIKEAPNWLSSGIALYTSSDLMTWRDEGIVLHGSQVNDMPFPAPYRIERPKVVYNAAHDYWVLMWHLDTPHFLYPSVGVATAPNLSGPYTFRHTFRPDGRDSYDMTLYQSPSTGQAWLVRSVENHFMGVSALSSDYLNTTGICSIAPRQEAPAMFEANGQFYIVSSHLTGWAPNPPMLFASAAMCGEDWAALAVPAQGAGAFNDYNTQPTFVFAYPFPNGKRLLVLMADLWNPYGPGGVGNATYAWFPLTPSDLGGFAYEWQDVWRIEDFAWAAVDGLVTAAPTTQSGAVLRALRGAAASWWHRLRVVLRWAAPASAGGQGADGVPAPLRGADAESNRAHWAAVEEASLHEGALQGSD